MTLVVALLPALILFGGALVALLPFPLPQRFRTLLPTLVCVLSGISLILAARAATGPQTLFAANEALGQSLDLIIPERFRARHWEGYKQVMATGSTKYGAQVLRVPAQHRNGKALSIAFTVSLLDAPDRKEKLIVAIVRDETARWSEERELRRRLTELERQAK